MVFKSGLQLGNGFTFAASTGQLFVETGAALKAEGITEGEGDVRQCSECGGCPGGAATVGLLC